MRRHRIQRQTAKPRPRLNRPAHLPLDLPLHRPLPHPSASWRCVVTTAPARRKTNPLPQAVVAVAATAVVAQALVAARVSGVLVQVIALVVVPAATIAPHVGHAWATPHSAPSVTRSNTHRPR